MLKCIQQIPKLVSSTKWKLKMRVPVTKKEQVDTGSRESVISFSLYFGQAWGGVVVECFVQMLTPTLMTIPANMTCRVKQQKHLATHITADWQTGQSFLNNSTGIFDL